MNDKSGEKLALRLRETARMIGVSPRTLWQWCRDGLIPHVRVGSGGRQMILFSIDQLRAWLLERTKRPAEEGR